MNNNKFKTKKKGGRIELLKTYKIKNLKSFNRDFIEIVKSKGITNINLIKIYHNMILISTNDTLYLLYFNNNLKIKYIDSKKINNEIRFIEFIDPNNIVIVYNNRIEVVNLTNNNLAYFYNSSITITSNNHISGLNLNNKMYLCYVNKSTVQLEVISNKSQNSNSKTFYDGKNYSIIKVRLVHNNQDSMYLVSMVKDDDNNYLLVIQNLNRNSEPFEHNISQFSNKVHDFDCLFDNNKMYITLILDKGEYYENSGLVMIAYDPYIRSNDTPINVMYFGKVGKSEKSNNSESLEIIHLNTHISKIIVFNSKYIVIQKKFSDKYLYLIINHPLENREFSWRIYEIKNNNNDIRLFNLIFLNKDSLILALYNEKHTYLDTLIH
jgi:hypothetical protein